jgi:superfamily I DNA/RNA helicase
MARSVQQEAVVNYAIVAGGHLVVRALAGCGKSYTLMQVVIEALKKDPSGEITVVAYNKAIAQEFQTKLTQEGIDSKKARAMTMHAAGFSALRGYLQRMKGVQVGNPDDKKISQIVQNLQVECASLASRPGLTPEQIREAQEKAEICETQMGFVTKAVSLAKQRAFGVAGCPNIDDDAAWMELFEHFGLMEDLDEAFD